MEKGMLTRDGREALLELSTALVVDAMDSLGLAERVLCPSIRPVVPFSKMAGTALTVKIESQPDRSKARLDVYREALLNREQVYSPIVVVEVPEEHHNRGIFGGGTATLAVRNGFAGALIEGAVRDTDDLRGRGFPVFSRGISCAYIVGRVESVSSGEPVCVGGVTIAAGQIIFGDNDGVVVIDADDLDRVITKARAVKDWEDRIHSLYAAGEDPGEAISRLGSKP